MVGFETLHSKGSDDDSWQRSYESQNLLYMSQEDASVSASRICNIAIEALSVAKATTCVSELTEFPSGVPRVVHNGLFEILRRTLRERVMCSGYRSTIAGWFWIDSKLDRTCDLAWCRPDTAFATSSAFPPAIDPCWTTVVLNNNVWQFTYFSVNEYCSSNNSNNEGLIVNLCPVSLKISVAHDSEY